MNTIVIIVLLVIAVGLFIYHQVEESRFERWLDKQRKRMREQTAWMNYKRNH